VRGQAGLIRRRVSKSLYCDQEKKWKSQYTEQEILELTNANNFNRFYGGGTAHRQGEWCKSPERGCWGK
jgi:hypothetical protein